ncbi:hypothetical protein Pelo_6958 [Pelomyxa schiedti]|nr:hypothetical protein Pelo_6958 [Pelomyxa schiedti]
MPMKDGGGVGNWLIYDSMKRRRQGPETSTAASARTPQQSVGAILGGDKSAGLDQLVPSAVMDIIVAYLLSPPFPSLNSIGVTTDLVNFALCSRTCLAACERSSMMLHLRSLLRPKFTVLAATARIHHKTGSGGGYDDPEDDEYSVSEELVRGDREDEAVIQEAVFTLNKALCMKKWIRMVHESVLGSIRDPVAHHDDDLIVGRRLQWFTSRIFLIDSSREDIDQKQYIETDVHGAVWFYPRSQVGCQVRTRRDQRVFVYCRGFTNVSEYDNESIVTLWYCVSDCGCVPSPPPKWVPRDMNHVMTGQEETRTRILQKLGMGRYTGRDRDSMFAPWVRAAEKQQDDETWQIGGNGQRNVNLPRVEVGQFPAVVALCGLAGLPVAECCDFLTALTRCAKCGVLLDGEDTWSLFRQLEGQVF